MKQLTHSFVLLICALAFFFNVERLDFSEENVINIQSFVYLIGFAAVVIILLIPRLGRLPLIVSIGLFISIYLFIKLFIANPTTPVWGGNYTYLFITELSLLILLIYLAHRTANHVQQFKVKVEDVLLPQTGRYLRSVEEASEAIRIEVRRNRHYNRPMSVIVVQPDQLAGERVFGQMLQEMQQTVLSRYTKLRLAYLLKTRLRDIDLVLEQQGKEDFIVFCPEIDDSETKSVADRIRLSASELGIGVRCSTAVFPQEGLSFEALVEYASNDLKKRTTVKQRVDRGHDSAVLANGSE